MIQFFFLLFLQTTSLKQFPANQFSFVFSIAVMFVQCATMIFMSSFPFVMLSRGYARLYACRDTKMWREENEEWINSTHACRCSFNTRVDTVANVWKITCRRLGCYDMDFKFAFPFERRQLRTPFLMRTCYCTRYKLPISRYPFYMWECANQFIRKRSGYEPETSGGSWSLR